MRSQREMGLITKLRTYPGWHMGTQLLYDAGADEGGAHQLLARAVGRVGADGAWGHGEEGSGAEEGSGEEEEEEGEQNENEEGRASEAEQHEEGSDSQDSGPRLPLWSQVRRRLFEGGRGEGQSREATPSTPAGPSDPAGGAPDSPGHNQVTTRRGIRGAGGGGWC